MEQKFTLNNFELELSKTDERLLIQAKHTVTGTLFSKAVTQEVAKALSHEHNLDPNMIYALLKDYIESNPPNTTLTLTEDGILDYSCLILYGKLKKQLSFSIELEQENLQPVGKLEDQIVQLKKKMCDMEQVYEKKLNDRVLELEKANEKRYKDLEKLVLEKFEKLETMLVKSDERLVALEHKTIVKAVNESQKVNEKRSYPVVWNFTK